MRRFLPFALLLLLLASCVREDSGEGDLSIVAVDFPSFDAARAVLGGDDGLAMLLPPGTESHSYDPTPKDMVTIAEADLIIYTGGHSDAWVDSILSSLSSPPRAFRLMEQVPLLSEERTEGMEDDGHGHHEGSDEHVWTSPVNEAAIVSSLADAISAIEPERSEELYGNAEAYIASLEALDGEIRKIVEESPIDTLIFASRFPLLYFVKEYGIRYYAAFPGCAEETEPSARTVAFLIDKAKELGVPCSFADISGFAGVCEVSDDRAGYMPELSYGSHMFQDLVEAEIFYCAIWNDKRTLRYDPELLAGLPNKFSEICPNMPELAGMFRVTEPEGLCCWLDAVENKAVCGYKRLAK